MADEPRIRRGGWAYAALIAVALVVFAVVNAASRGAGDRRPDPRAASTPPATPDVGTLGLGGPSIPGIRLAPRTVRGVGPHCEQTTCCPTEVLTYATSATIDRVIAYFQAHGYRYAAPPLVSAGNGDPHTSGTYLRWLGELPGDVHHWRLANVATGPVDGHPRWTTVFRVTRARCEGARASSDAGAAWPAAMTRARPRRTPAQVPAAIAAISVGITTSPVAPLFKARSASVTRAWSSTSRAML